MMKIKKEEPLMIRVRFLFGLAFVPMNRRSLF